MPRVVAMFVAACMVLISASFAAVLHLGFGLPLTGAVICGIAALTGFSLWSVAAAASRARASPAEILDMSRGIADLARQVTDLARRLAVAESKAAEASSRAQAAASLSADIEEVGSIVKELAEAVSVHELVLHAAGLVPLSAGASAIAGGTAAPSPTAPSAGDTGEAAAIPKPSDGGDKGGAAILGSSPPVGGKAQPGNGFTSLAPEQTTSAIREAIEANRLELHLQPIVTLPQRKVRYYEALARLRMADASLVAAEDFISLAQAGALMPRLDNQMVFGCVQVVRRLISKNRADLGLFCNIAASTLADGSSFTQLLEFMSANRAIAAALVFELAQGAYRSFGGIENESLAALTRLGFRWSLDRVTDLRFEPRDLADRGFRFVKVPAALLLGRERRGTADIHPADLAGLLTRFGIDLVVEKIENEATVADLLDHNVKYGQGYLFAPPRPLRAEVLQAPLDRSKPLVPGESDAGAILGGAAASSAYPDEPTRSNGLTQIARPTALRPWP